MRQKPNGTAIILVGNKCDLEEERRVSYDDGSSLARLFGCPFTETSAKNQINVENVFNYKFFFYHLESKAISNKKLLKIFVRHLLFVVTIFCSTLQIAL